jgi:hypothetical protein
LLTIPVYLARRPVKAGGCSSGAECHLPSMPEALGLILNTEKEKKNDHTLKTI